MSKLIGRLLLLLTLAVSTGTAIATPIGIYWTDYYAGTVSHANLDGSNVTTLVSGLSQPSGLAIFDNSIYWADTINKSIGRSDIDGSSPTTVVSTPGSPRDVAVTNDAIYWASTGSLDSISKSNLDGTGIDALVTSDLSFPNSIFIFEDRIYWADSGTSNIRSSGLDGSGVVELVAGITDTYLPTGLFVTEDFIYWATRDLALTQGGTAIPGTIQRADIDGSNMVTLVNNLIFPQNVFVTGDYLYWTDQYAGRIQRSDLSGNGIIDVIGGLNSPLGLVIVADAAPTPATLPLMALGLAALGYSRRKRITS